MNVQKLRYSHGVRTQAVRDFYTPMLASRIKAVFCSSGILCAALLILMWAVGFISHVLAEEPPQQSRAVEQPTLFGHVVDGVGSPVADASVELKLQDGTSSITVTDASGYFSFKAVRPGDYTLSAQKSGTQSATISISTFMSTLREFWIVLQPPQNQPTRSSLSQPKDGIEFSDKPNFTVAGVTDWTAVGGHGSDTTLRASEDLTREMITLDLEAGKSASGKERPNTGETQETRLRAAVAANPRDYAAVRDLGDYYLHAARYEQAVPLLKTASDLNQASADDEFSLALACEGAGDLRQAHKHVEHALAQKDVADFHRVLGELDEKLGDPLAAVQQEQRATRMDPTEQNYFVWGSELLFHRAIWQSAEVFENGAKLYPLSVRIKTGWGAALFAGAKYDEAARRLCDASDLDPNDAEPYLFLGKISIAAPASLPCVQQKLERFVQLRPERADANYLYAMFLLKNNLGSDVRQIESSLRKAVALDPSYSEAYLQLGVLSFTRRDYPEAIDLFTKAIKANPQQAEAHYRLGVAYDRTGKPQQAQQEFQIHDQLVKAQADAVEQQRRQVKQFLVVLRESPPTP